MCSRVFGRLDRWRWSGLLQKTPRNVFEHFVWLESVQKLVCHLLGMHGFLLLRLGFLRHEFYSLGIWDQCIYIIDDIRSKINEKIYVNQCKTIWFESNQILPFLNQFQSNLLPISIISKISAYMACLGFKNVEKQSLHLMFWFYIFYFY